MCRLRDILIMLLLSLSLGSTAAVAAGSSALSAQLAGYLKARADLGHFSGSVLVAKDGAIVFSKGYGMANSEFAAPNGPETRYLVASITKQFTAAAILKLRDSGKLTLEDPLCRWIDRCPGSWRKITLRHLLSHKSGIWDYEDALGMGSPEYAAEMARPDHVARFLDRARMESLKSEPGKEFHYSNTGFLFLARVIEKASSRSYKSYVENEVLKPAGLISSGVFDGSPVHRLASGYRLDDDLSREVLLNGIPVDRLPLKTQSVGFLTGDHGDAALYTTAADLHRWFLALDAGKVLKLSSVAEMRIATSDAYGLGLAIESRFGRTAYAHSGVLAGYLSRAEWYPKARTSIIVLSNLENSRLSKIARDLAAITFVEPYDLPQSHDVVSLTKGERSKFMGEYFLADRSVTIKQTDEMLVLSGVSFNAGMLPIGKDRFFLPLFEGTLHFRRHKDGSIADANLHYEGADHILRIK